MGIEKLESEIAVAEKDVNDTKIEIADLFLKIHEEFPKEKPTFEDFAARFEDMAKMPELIDKLKQYECRRNTLLDSKLLLESSETEVLVKN